MKGDMSRLTTDVAVLKSDMVMFKTDIAEIKIAVLKQRHVTCYPFLNGLAPISILLISASMPLRSAARNRSMAARNPSCATQCAE